MGARGLKLHLQGRILSSLRNASPTFEEPRNLFATAPEAALSLARLLGPAGSMAEAVVKKPLTEKGRSLRPWGRQQTARPSTACSAASRARAIPTPTPKPNPPCSLPQPHPTPTQVYP